VYDSAYGQSVSEAWVLVGPDLIPYVFYTGRHGAGLPYKRWEVDGFGVQSNYGRIVIRKNTVGSTTPELRLEETGAGSNYTALRAAAAITSDHTYVFPAALANGLFNNLVSGATGTLSMLTAVRGDLLYGNATPAWAKLAVGGAGTVLTSNGTDVSWTAPASGGLSDGDYGDIVVSGGGTVMTIDSEVVNASKITNRVRTVDLPVDTFSQSNGTAMTFGYVGTYPNRYKRWQFVTAPATQPQGIFRFWRVPDDYVSGGRVILLWTTQDLVPDDGTWEARVRYYVLDDVAEDDIANQDSLTGVATSIVKVSTTVGLLTLPTPRAINAAQSMARLDSGTDMTGLTAGDIVRLHVERNSNSVSDNYADSVDLVGVYITYTADS
jgi:hypothetical protein